MNNFEKIAISVILFLALCILFFLGYGCIKLNEIADYKKKYYTLPSSYDYVIDLKQDEMFVYRKDGREFAIEYGELEEFFLEDNI